MADTATPNLPSADFDRTENFYAALGFARRFRADHWMILDRAGPNGRLTLEFFFAHIDPKTSAFGACLRVDDLDALHADFQAASISRKPTDVPRLGAIAIEHGLIRIFYLNDPDNSLIRCLDNGFAPEAAASS